MRERTPGDILLHPVALIALAVLVANDHYLKAIAQGTVTGKLSDVAGLVVFPLLVLALVEVVRRRATSSVGVLVIVVVTGVVFALVKVSPSAAHLYSQSLGVLAWPFRSIAGGAPSADVSPITVLADPSDLLVLPALLVAYVVAVARCPDTNPGGLEPEHDEAPSTWGQGPGTGLVEGEATALGRRMLVSRKRSTPATGT